jgi:hypothetical protein
VHTALAMNEETQLVTSLSLPVLPLPRQYRSTIDEALARVLPKRAIQAPAPSGNADKRPLREAPPTEARMAKV